MQNKHPHRKKVPGLESGVFSVRSLDLLSRSSSFLPSISEIIISSELRCECECGWLFTSVG